MCSLHRYPTEINGKKLWAMHNKAGQGKMDTLGKKAHLKQKVHIALCVSILNGTKFMTTIFLMTGMSILPLTAYCGEKEREGF